jgi:hypothetical protein
VPPPARVPDVIPEDVVAGSGTGDVQWPVRHQLFPFGDFLGDFEIKRHEVHTSPSA